MATTSETLASALRYHQAGKLAQAERCYRQVVQAEPTNHIAWHQLGLLAHQAKQPQKALDCLRRALALCPDNAAIHGNIGVIFQSHCKWDEAIACFRQALRLRPDLSEIHLNLGKSLYGQGNALDAIPCYREALRLRSSYLEAEHYLGIAYFEQGRLAEAEACFQRVLLTQPDNAESHNSLGGVLAKQGRLKDAEQCFRRALQLRPENVQALTNLGLARFEQGDLQEAQACFERAVVLRPDDAMPRNYLGIIHGLLGRETEAIASFEQALRVRPGYADAHNNLGNVLRQQNRLDEAVACYEQALRLQPDYAKPHHNLGNALLEQGRPTEAIARYREALRLAPDSYSTHSNVLFCLCHDPASSAADLFEEHRRWGDLHGTPAEPIAPHGNDRAPDRRLRIGYVSPDFRAHAVASFVEPLLRNHDPAALEVFCYADVAAADGVTRRLSSLAHVWRPTFGLPDQQLAEQIRNDCIDILVDLAGHTANHRLRVFARKPAPVQITYLGYPCTTGLQTMDYRLTDSVIDPPGECDRYTEELVHLPGYSCFGPPEEAPDVGALPALRNGCVTFGSLHRLSRLNAAVLDLWGRILEMLPSARLLIFRNTVKGEAKDLLERRLIERGIAANRFELRCTIEGKGRYLGVYRDIDVSLDTLPWSGHTTACESMYMGVPVITLRGQRTAGRLVASVLTQAGLTEWIAETPDQYVALALKLAADPERLAAYRGSLREKLRGSLCDGPMFTRKLEVVYRRLWQRWCQTFASGRR